MAEDRTLKEAKRKMALYLSKLDVSFEELDEIEDSIFDQIDSNQEEIMTVKEIESMNPTMLHFDKFELTYDEKVGRYVTPKDMTDGLIYILEFQNKSRLILDGNCRINTLSKANKSQVLRVKIIKTNLSQSFFQ